jgi:hypothetical protein
MVMRTIIVKCDTIFAHKKLYTQTKMLFVDADSILYDELDKLTILFEDTDFRNEYKSTPKVIVTSLCYKKEKDKK